MNVFISAIDKFEPELPDSASASLTLSNGETFKISKHDERFPLWVKFLTHRAGTGKLVYVEAHSPDGPITRLLIPLPRTVRDITEEQGDEGLIIRTLESPNLFLVRRGHPSFGNYVEMLNTAKTTNRPVLLTTDPESNEVLDVRPFDALLSEQPGSSFLARIRALSEQQASYEFGFLAGQPQIPFLYIKDCCIARAHEMCRLLRRDGIECRKVWNYGRLHVNTVDWFFHVAPLVQVRLATGALVDMVFDPSLFDRPVTIHDWQGRQNDPQARCQISDADVYSREVDDLVRKFDPYFVDTEESLLAHSLALAN